MGIMAPPLVSVSSLAAFQCFFFCEKKATFFLIFDKVQLWFAGVSIEVRKTQVIILVKSRPVRIMKILVSAFQFLRLFAGIECLLK